MHVWSVEERERGKVMKRGVCVCVCVGGGDEERCVCGGKRKGGM